MSVGEDNGSTARATRRWSRKVEPTVGGSCPRAKAIRLAFRRLNSELQVISLPRQEPKPRQRRADRCPLGSHSRWRIRHKDEKLVRPPARARSAKLLVATSILCSRCFRVTAPRGATLMRLFGGGSLAFGNDFSNENGGGTGQRTLGPTRSSGEVLVSLGARGVASRVHGMRQS
jgi:hypothetical protein